jgi:hypothetical protein
MRNNNNDKTLEKNYIQKWRFLIKEYELTKAGKHPQFRFVTDFYKFHGTSRQTFCKYYNRFLLSNRANDALLPQKRGPKWHVRKPIHFIEKLVIEKRKLGINRYEIKELLQPILKHFTPSPSGIYNICKRYNLNRLTKQMKESKRKIIKEKAGDLAHIDCHYLPKGLVMNNNERYYLVGVVDDCTRIAWCEIVQDITSLTVMFATMRCFQMIQKQYDIQFKEVMTDNGPEFGQGKDKKNEMTNPFKRMVKEMGLKQRFIRPYHPQTNGKIERFWRTIEEDIVEGTTFESLEEFENDLFEYMIYYNEYRPHQGLNGQIPAKFNKNLQENS